MKLKEKKALIHNEFPQEGGAPLAARRVLNPRLAQKMPKGSAGSSRCFAEDLQIGAWAQLV
jgi:hypothetical protein